MDPNAIMEVLSPVIANLVLTLIGAVITGVGGWLMMFIKSKLNASQLALLEDIAADVVLAVEQSTYGSELAENADAKKQAALTMLSGMLKKYGINLSAEQMDTAIEAAVANVINANKLVEPPKMVELETPPQNDFFG